MKICCCDFDAPDQSWCPVDGAKGEPVKKVTVAAMALGPVPADGSFFVCRSSSCSVVYFGSDGTVLTTDQVRMVPSFKNGGSDLICYCFEHTEAVLIEEVERSGRSTALESIESQLKAGNCACEIRNPDGRCCLKRARALVERAQLTRKELA
jgi:hypothetical protein